MPDPSSLPKYPLAARANEIGMRQGPLYTRSTSGFAVASFVFGIIGGFVLSIIFGAIALGRTGPTGQRGRWMAVTGLVSSGLWIAGIATAVIMDLQTDADRDTAGEIVAAGNVSTRSLHVGDCLEEVPAEAPVVEVPAIPCGSPHRGEVIGSFELTMEEFPDQAQLGRVALQECARLLRGYSPAAYDDPDTGMVYLAPVEQAWPERREVVCIADRFGAEMTGSLSDL